MDACMVVEVSSLAMVMVEEGWHHLPSTMVESICWAGMYWMANEGIDVVVVRGRSNHHTFICWCS